MTAPDANFPPTQLVVDLVGAHIERTIEELSAAEFQRRVAPLDAELRALGWEVVVQIRAVDEDARSADVAVRATKRRLP